MSFAPLWFADKILTFDWIKNHNQLFLGKSQKEKPSIIVSGADDGRVYLLRPQSWS